MTKLVLCAVVVVACALIIGCASDIYLDPPPSLAGRYAGTYARTDQGGSGVKQEQNILWLFTDQKWVLDVDKDQYTSFQICESFGRYSLEDRVRLTVDGSQPVGTLPGGDNWSSCSDGLNPIGLFTLDRSTSTVVLLQLITDEAAGTSILVEIRLDPVTDDD